MDIKGNSKTDFKWKFLNSNSFLKTGSSLGPSLAQWDEGNIETVTVLKTFRVIQVGFLSCFPHPLIRVVGTTFKIFLTLFPSLHTHIYHPSFSDHPLWPTLCSGLSLSLQLYQLQITFSKTEWCLQSVTQVMWLPCGKLFPLCLEWIKVLTIMYKAWPCPCFLPSLNSSPTPVTRNKPLPAPFPQNFW